MAEHDGGGQQQTQRIQIDTAPLGESLVQRHRSTPSILMGRQSLSRSTRFHVPAADWSFSRKDRRNHMPNSPSPLSRGAGKPSARMAARRPQTAAWVACRFGYAAAITSRPRGSATRAPATIAAWMKAWPRAVRATISDRPGSVRPSGGVCQGSPTDMSAKAPV